MKKKNLVLVAVIFLFFILASCGSNNTDNKTNNNEDTNELESDVEYDLGYEEEDFLEEEGTVVGTISEKLVFIEASSFEGEADLVFENMLGEKINFYLNYFDQNQPELDYTFIGEDGMTANPELIGKTFFVDYELVEGGRITVEGDEEDCYIITKVELN